MHANIHVFTFREGLFGKLGHDLRMSLTRFVVTARGNEVSARCEPASLVVDGAVKGGTIDAGELSASDREKIHESIVEDVLHTGRYPEVLFSARTSSKEAPFVIEGQLTLLGVSRPISLTLEAANGRLVGSVELKPSLWGVKPFRALGGALKVQDRVVVAIDASAETLEAGAALNPAVELVWSP